MPAITRRRIDLAALAHNAKLVRQFAPAAKVLAMVKAQAYGHGAVAVAAALANTVDGFGVARLEEALELREAGIVQPIIVMAGALLAEELQLAQHWQLGMVVHTPEQLQLMERVRLKQPLAVWLKLDTGMSRLGVPCDQAHSAVGRLRASGNVADIVLMTHFAASEELDNDLTERQMAAFDNACAGLDYPHSLANSAAIMAWPNSHRQWVRPGYMLYGASSFGADYTPEVALRPVMQFESRVMAVREISAGTGVGYNHRWVSPGPRRIATIGAGYGDGYPRHARDGTPVLINGQRAPLVGRVSMDYLTVDVTALPPIAVGDIAQLWGDALAVAEVAEHAGSIGYELLTRMPGRATLEYC